MVTEFLTIVTGFPTVIFSGLLGLAFVYWLIVSVGMLDMDFLDGAMGMDALDGGLETLDAGVEAIDGALESVDGSLDGALESVDGAADGSLEAGEADADLDQPSTALGALAGLMNALGLRGVPITLSISFFVLWAWLVSALTVHWLGAPRGVSVLTLGALAVAFVGASLLTRVSVKPFKPLFRTVSAPGRASLVGRMCEVTSGRANATSGQAEIDDGGSGFIADVRCRKGVELRRGDKALVFQYDQQSEIFYIGPVDQAIHKADELMKEQS